MWLAAKAVRGPKFARLGIRGGEGLAERESVGVELPPEFGLGDESARLAEHGVQGSGIENVMSADGQNVLPSAFECALQLDVASALGVGDESMPLQDAENLVPGQESKLGPQPAPTPS